MEVVENCNQCGVEYDTEDVVYSDSKTITTKCKNCGYVNEIVLEENQPSNNNDQI